MNPLLIGILLVIGVLLVLDLDYQSYYESAQHLSFLLTPATVCMAIPLYRQLEVLKRHRRAILVGTLSGVITSLSLILLFSFLFSYTGEQYATLLPKSVTSAIGMGISRELGGNPTLTVTCIILTGIVGNVGGEFFSTIFKIKNPIAKGVAIGTASHAIGTAKALELGEVEGAMSSLSVAVAGLMTVILAPIYAGFF